MAVFVPGARMSLTTMSGRLVGVLVLLAMVRGCASSAPKKPPTGTPRAGQIPVRARHRRAQQAGAGWCPANTSGSWSTAIPQSEYRADAKLGVGDTYIGEGSAESFVLAINEFREFLNFYPTHKRADYAQFKLGDGALLPDACAERDQTETREAIAELQTFVSAFRTRNLIDEGQTYAARGERPSRDSDYRRRRLLLPLEVVSRRHRSAEDAPRERPGSTRGRDAVYFYLGESYIKMYRPAEALPYLRAAREGIRAERISRAGAQAHHGAQSGRTGQTHGGSK